MNEGILMESEEKLLDKTINLHKMFVHLYFHETALDNDFSDEL